jgi:hypothetical protein
MHLSRVHKLTLKIHYLAENIRQGGASLGAHMHRGWIEA